jgi:hypothetical protein
MLKLKVEDLNALRFILQDDLYLLEKDKSYYNTILKPQPAIETPQIKFNYLGTNKKNFLILVNYPDHELMADEHLTALESVLNRKGHSREDVAILNLAHIVAEYEQLAVYFNPKTLILLGQASIPRGLKHPKFNQFENSTGLNVLYTFSFDEMMANNENKKTFWDQMKTI